MRMKMVFSGRQKNLNGLVVAGRLPGICLLDVQGAMACRL